MPHSRNTPALNPTEVARDALRTLAAQRVPPTPDNYRKTYLEIAGTSSDALDATDAEIRDSVAKLPANAPWRGTVHERVNKALESRDWEGARAALSTLVRLLNDTGARSQTNLPQSWKEELSRLFKEWDIEHAGWTRAQKRKSIEHALLTPIRDPEKIFVRLRNTIAQWKHSDKTPKSTLSTHADPDTDSPASDAAGSQSQAALLRTDPPARTASGEHATSVDTLSDFVPQLCECMAMTLAGPLPLLLAHAPQLATQARMLAKVAREVRDRDAARELIAAVDTLSRLIADTVGGDHLLRDSLLTLLRLLVDNMHQLLSGDAWLRTQLDLVRELLANPLSAGTIADAENAMRALMAKQLELKSSVETARDDLKALVHSFLDRLGGLAASTGEYHDKLEIYNRRINEADDIQSLGALLRDLMTDTRAMQETTFAVHAELTSARQRVEHADVQIQDMERKLAAMSERTREDPLTGVLNRRGLETTFDLRAAEADKDNEPLCVALVDVDNFKALNDRLGHLAGDAALRHLVDVVRSNLRPQDKIARYGGEEFVLLLPATDAAAAVDLMIRLQRRLTKHFFMYKQERTLITFSCGTTRRMAGESLETVLERADRAMYVAKRAGKNRVVGAETLDSADA